MSKSTICIPQLFEEIAVHHPNRKAVLFNGKSMSYQELNEEANSVAGKLIDIDIPLNQCIGVFMERSFHLISCLLGILKSRAVYVPISIEYPEERIKHIIQDAGITVVITEEKLMPIFKNINELILLDINKIREYSPLSNNQRTQLLYDTNDTAYVLYTSGTTGYPKGVAIQHSGICNHLLWMKETYKLHQGDILLHKTPISFDVSVCEILYPLISGAVLCIANPDSSNNVRKLISEINDNQITMVMFIPPLLDLFLDCLKPGDCQSLKTILCGGEKWSYSLGMKTLKKLNVELYNVYGPTEASIGVAYWKFEDTYPNKKIPIGKPITHTKFYILDEKLDYVKYGDIGELCITGICLSSGYLNNPDLTNIKFVPNPYNYDNEPSYSRLYRSGDLVRQLEDGNLEYVGRTDGQVKIRGMRLELGEVENAFLSNEAVSAAVVLYHESDGNSFLSGHVLPSKLNHHIIEDQLKIYLKEKIPEYMIPNFITIHDKFPTTLNGKTDKEQLKLLIEK